MVETGEASPELPYPRMQRPSMQPDQRWTLGAALALLEQTDWRGLVSSIRQPVLVIGGEHDTILPPAAGAWLANAPAKGSHALIAGAAHAPLLSHPAPFFQALEHFIDAR